MTETEPQTRILGYTPVDTYRQMLEAQPEQLMAAGSAETYREKAAGAKMQRRLLKAPGDVETVTRIDRRPARSSSFSSSSGSWTPVGERAKNVQPHEGEDSLCRR